jgi:hypothetical protein
MAPRFDENEPTPSPSTNATGGIETNRSPLGLDYKFPIGARYRGYQNEREHPDRAIHALDAA